MVRIVLGTFLVVAGLLTALGSAMGIEEHPAMAVGDLWLGLLIATIGGWMAHSGWTSRRLYRPKNEGSSDWTLYRDVALGVTAITLGISLIGVVIWTSTTSGQVTVKAQDVGDAEKFFEEYASDSRINQAENLPAVPLAPEARQYLEREYQNQKQDLLDRVNELDLSQDSQYRLARDLSKQIGAIERKIANLDRLSEAQVYNRAREEGFLTPGVSRGVKPEN